MRQSAVNLAVSKHENYHQQTLRNQISFKTQVTTHFYPEDGANRVPQDVGFTLPDYKVSQSKASPVGALKK